MYLLIIVICQSEISNLSISIYDLKNELNTKSAVVVTVLCPIELICIHLQFRRAIIRFVNYFYKVEALRLIIS